MRTTHGKEYHEWNNSQDDLLKLKVISVRYYETRRGTGYQCKTNKKMLRFGTMEMVAELILLHTTHIQRHIFI